MFSGQKLDSKTIMNYTFAFEDKNITKKNKKYERVLTTHEVQKYSQLFKL